MAVTGHKTGTAVLEEKERPHPLLGKFCMIITDNKCHRLPLLIPVAVLNAYLQFNLQGIKHKLAEINSPKAGKVLGSQDLNLARPASPVHSGAIAWCLEVNKG